MQRPTDENLEKRKKNQNFAKMRQSKITWLEFERKLKFKTT